MEAFIGTGQEHGYTTLLLFPGLFDEAVQWLYEDLGFEYATPFEWETPEKNCMSLFSCVLTDRIISNLGLVVAS